MASATNLARLACLTTNTAVNGVNVEVDTYTFTVDQSALATESALTFRAGLSRLAKIVAFSTVAEIGSKNDADPTAISKSCLACQRAFASVANLTR